MTDSQTAPASHFSFWKVLLPVFIGLGVVAYMFWRDAREEGLAGVWTTIHFDTRAVLCILLGWFFMLGRDFGLTWRFRALTDKKLRWSQAWRVDMLCEFTSCITPSAVGGSSLGMVFLNREGIEFGRATTLMITTLFLDELFFVVACPLVILFTPANEIFLSESTGFSHGIQLTFWLVYSGIVVWTMILFTGIILYPIGFNRFLVKLFSLKFLRRWQPKVASLASNMQATSTELRKKPLRFWLEVFGGTALSWTSRYLVVNALFLGFLPSADPEQWVILARQFVVWVVLMVSPTPGGAGLSEWLFTEYYADLVPTAALALVLAIFWRILSYYIYLIIGACLVPKWLSDTFSSIHNKKKENEEQ